MGWGRWLLLGDLGQQLDLATQQQELQKLQSQLRTKQTPGNDRAAQLEALRRENDELKLYLASVIRLLVAKGLVSKEEVATIVEALDAEDGKKDGRYTGDLGALE